MTCPGAANVPGSETVLSLWTFRFVPRPCSDSVVGLVTFPDNEEEGTSAQVVPGSRRGCHLSKVVIVWEALGSRGG